MDVDAKTEVNTTTLAAVLGITGRRVQQLTQDGVLSTHQKKYPLFESVHRYVEFRAKEKTVSKIELDRQEAEVSLKKAKAITAVLEAKELQGQMHRSEDVAALTEDLTFTIRGMLLALPGRLAVDVAAVTDAADAAEVIKREVYKVMEELSRYRYDSSKYEERVRERRAWSNAGGTDGDDDGA